MDGLASLLSPIIKTVLASPTTLSLAMGVNLELLVCCWSNIVQLLTAFHFLASLLNLQYWIICCSRGILILTESAENYYFLNYRMNWPNEKNKLPVVMFVLLVEITDLMVLLRWAQSWSSFPLFFHTIYLCIPSIFLRFSPFLFFNQRRHG